MPIGPTGVADCSLPCHEPAATSVLLNRHCAVPQPHNRYISGFGGSHPMPSPDHPVIICVDHDQVSIAEPSQLHVSAKFAIVPVGYFPPREIGLNKILPGSESPQLLTSF